MANMLNKTDFINKITEIQKENGLSSQTIENMITRGFIAPITDDFGNNVYDYDYLKRPEIFEKLYNDYNRTSDMLTVQELKDEIASKAGELYSVPINSFNLLASNNILKKDMFYCIRPGYYLFSPDLLDVDTIKNALEELDSKIEQEEAEELEISENIETSEEPVEKNEKEPDENEEPVVEFDDYDERAESAQKRKQKNAQKRIEYNRKERERKAEEERRRRAELESETYNKVRSSINLDSYADEKDKYDKQIGITKRAMSAQEILNFSYLEESRREEYKELKKSPEEINRLYDTKESTETDPYADNLNPKVINVPLSDGSYMSFEAKYEEKDVSKDEIRRREKERKEEHQIEEKSILRNEDGTMSFSGSSIGKEDPYDNYNSKAQAAAVAEGVVLSQGAINEIIANISNSPEGYKANISVSVISKTNDTTEKKEVYNSQSGNLGTIIDNYYSAMKVEKPPEITDAQIQADKNVLYAIGVNPEKINIEDGVWTPPSVPSINTRIFAELKQQGAEYVMVSGEKIEINKMMDYSREFSVVHNSSYANAALAKEQINNALSSDKPLSPEVLKNAQDILSKNEESKKIFNQSAFKGNGFNQDNPNRDKSFQEIKSTKGFGAVSVLGSIQETSAQIDKSLIRPSGIKTRELENISALESAKNIRENDELKSANFKNCVKKQVDIAPEAIVSTTPMLVMTEVNNLGIKQTTLVTFNSDGSLNVSWGTKENSSVKILGTVQEIKNKESKDFDKSIIGQSKLSNSFIKRREMLNATLVTAGGTFVLNQDWIQNNIKLTKFEIEPGTDLKDKRVSQLYALYSSGQWDKVKEAEKIQPDIISGSRTDRSINSEFKNQLKKGTRQLRGSLYSLVNMADGTNAWERTSLNTGYQKLFGKGAAVRIVYSFGKCVDYQEGLKTLNSSQLSRFTNADKKTYCAANGTRLHFNSAKDRMKILKDLKNRSKAYLGSDITRNSTYSLKEILKNNSFNGAILTEEQKEIVQQALLARGLIDGDLSLADVKGYYSQKGIHLKGRFDFSRRKDINKALNQLSAIASAEYKSVFEKASLQELTSEEIARLVSKVDNERLQTLLKEVLNLRELTGKTQAFAQNIKGARNNIALFSKNKLLKLTQNSYLGEMINKIYRGKNKIKSISSTLKMLRAMSSAARKQFINKYAGKELGKFGQKVLKNFVNKEARISKRAKQIRRLKRRSKAKLKLSKRKRANARKAFNNKLKAKSKLYSNASHRLNKANNAIKKITSKRLSRLKNLGNKLAKPFKAVSHVINNITTKIKEFLLKLGIKALKYIAITVGILFLIISVVCIVTGVADSIVGVFHNLDESFLSEKEHLSPEETIVVERNELCINLDSALKLYVESFYDNNDVVKAVINSMGEDAKKWFDPDKNKNLNLQSIGTTVDGVQTGIHYSYYNGDGEEIGYKSNAKDISSLANSWIETDYSCKGLYKSYVEKLWNHSHMIAYGPKKQPNGSFIYACDSHSSQSPCNTNSYQYQCNDSNARVYNASEGFAISQAIHNGYELVDGNKVTADDSLKISNGIRTYNEHGCERHEVSYASDFPNNSDKIINTLSGNVLTFDNYTTIKPNDEAKVYIYEEEPAFCKAHNCSSKIGNDNSVFYVNNHEHKGPLYYCTGYCLEINEKASDGENLKKEVKISPTIIVNHGEKVGSAPKGNCKTVCNDYTIVQKTTDAKVPKGKVNLEQATNYNYYSTSSSYYNEDCEKVYGQARSYYYSSSDSVTQIEYKTFNTSGSTQESGRSTIYPDFKWNGGYYYSAGFSSSPGSSGGVTWSYKYVDRNGSPISFSGNSRTLYHYSDSTYYTGVQQGTSTVDVYKCNGHCKETEEYTLTVYNRPAFCPGHTLKSYCTGHVDLNVGVVTLFLEDDNSLAYLGSPLSVTKDSVTHNSKTLTTYKASGSDYIYNHIPLFQNFGDYSQYPLPLIDAASLSDIEIDNDLNSGNGVENQIHTIEFLPNFTANYAQHAIDNNLGKSTLDYMMARLFCAFETDLWKDYNDIGDVSEEGGTGVLKHISHLKSLNAKFGKEHYFNGMCSYDNTGNIVRKNVDGKWVYASICRDNAMALAETDWKASYNISFPGAYNAIMSQDDIEKLIDYIKVCYDSNISNVPAGLINKARELLNSLGNQYAKTEIDGNVYSDTGLGFATLWYQRLFYAKNNRLNAEIKAANEIANTCLNDALRPVRYSPQEWEVLKSSPKAAYAYQSEAFRKSLANPKISSIYTNAGGDEASIETCIKDLRLGDMIGIGDEVYIVLYNDTKTVKDTDKNQLRGIDDGRVVVASVNNYGSQTDTVHLFSYSTQFIKAKSDLFWVYKN